MLRDHGANVGDHGANTQNSDDPKWLQSPFCCLAHTAHITLNNTVSNHYKDHHNHSHTWHDTVNNQLNKDHHNHSLLLLLFCIRSRVFFNGIGKYSAPKI